ncbi:MAG TPA: FAD-dependent oxidoreductase [Acidimicrobiales bacterium]|nr:FAD-dependent oxidoreductase [Acidimicrobiales bacterium]
MTVRFVVVGGGPAGTQAATWGARLGAEVTVVEEEVLGGAANLWDCIPSKAMIATGGLMSLTRRSRNMGLDVLAPQLDFDALRARNDEIEGRLKATIRSQLESQGVRLLDGVGRLKGPHEVVAETGDGRVVELDADAILLSTGSRPRIPPFAEPDGERVLVTRNAYPPPELQEHLCIVGSGVTGVEFTHMFSSFGCEVTLVVSRQQVLPTKDPEVAAALEADFIARGVQLLKGARASAIRRTGDSVRIECSDGRTVRASHVLLCIGSIPNSESLGLDAAAVEPDAAGYVTINHHGQTNVKHIYAAGDLSGKLPLASVAAMQGRKVAEHVMGLSAREHRHLDYDKAASAIFTEPEIADVGLAEADAFATGRKVRVTKVPFAATAKALIQGDARGFVKIVSDPWTGAVLGGSIVGPSAAELISVLALAVTANLKVNDIVESLLVHPALSEALAEAAE